MCSLLGMDKESLTFSEEMHQQERRSDLGSLSRGRGSVSALKARAVYIRCPVGWTRGPVLPTCSSFLPLASHTVNTLTLLGR